MAAQELSGDFTTAKLDHGDSWICIMILAAGYATRLYPLTLKKAKPLLDIAGKPMIERLVDHLGSVSRSENGFHCHE